MTPEISKAVEWAKKLVAECDALTKHEHLGFECAEKHHVMARALLESEKRCGELETSNGNLKKVIAYWWPLLGYSCFNEACYLPLEDSRGKTAPLFARIAELEACVKAQHWVVEAAKHYKKVPAGGQNTQLAWDALSKALAALEKTGVQS